MKKSNRPTYAIDASEKAIGRIATQAAILLRGKNKPEYEAREDAGGWVEVKNIGQAKFTGTKFTQKTYKHFSGYPGGLKRKKISDVFAKNPGEVLRRAVWNMLPKNKLRQDMIKRLKIL
ncbi:50S ribosomal protein L13 [Candidatus Falkowbacteria bacterium CG10_big_fil_rev_8_21_14_0_10_43_11]|uniref:Large ribosomal subunit protein uL13 n=1 Tax=Candidatus Falkowbacteria bacterium CG10_big_fil_rev_8_21_14_0_10_43_11 TaxID=1974568 RepID=A0A2M6WMB4_9BACT|nr:MAG: 50S ribosomal protein L13 [Candidatus Falkowbacteria bacterium CG10_big_fil_rev_8_21_14_0_10_43_11]